MHLFIRHSKYFVCDPHLFYETAGILVNRVVLLGDMAVEMVWHPGLPTEHQEVGSFTCAGVWRATVCPHYLWQHHIPFLLTSAEEEAAEGVA